MVLLFITADPIAAAFLEAALIDRFTATPGCRNKAKGGENMEMVEKRVAAFIKDLVKFMKLHKVNVAIAAHGNSIRAWRKIWEKLSVEEEMKLETPR